MQVKEKQEIIQEIIIAQKGTTRVVLSEIIRPNIFRYVLYTVDRGGYAVNHRSFRALSDAVDAAEKYTALAFL